MKNVLFILTAFLAFYFTSCSPSKDESSTTEYITVDDGEKVNTTIEVTTPEPLIPVGEENFQKLVSFIQTNGRIVYERGVPCDHQYTFFDEEGNRHAMITIKRDKEGHPSFNGVVNHISVWAYYKGIRDDEHFFSYEINTERAFPFITSDDYVQKHIEGVRLGYQTVLKKASGE